MADSITTLSLCSGVGWLDESVAAGCRYFGWGHRVAAYCEWEAYAASTLLARMEESSLEPAPVWSGDLGQFDGAGFRGAVDGITAGFPCQPWSAAGKQLGTEDDRWLWPAIVRLIDDVEPGFVFLENVAALIAGGGLEYVLSDLAARGFDAEWATLTAEAVGASHRRERVFILAYSIRRDWKPRAGRKRVLNHGESVADSPRGSERQRQRIGAATGAGSESGVEGYGEGVDDTAGPRLTQEVSGPDQRASGQRSGKRLSRNGRGAVADAIKPVVRQAEAGGSGNSRRTAAASAGGTVGNTASESAQGRRGEHAGQRISGRAGGSLFAPGPGADWSRIPEALWPATERGFRLLVDGRPVVLDASRADQLRCSGNGVVALQGAVAFIELVRRAGLTATR